MKLLYDANGTILTTLLKRDELLFRDTINVPYSVMEIDEIDENKDLILDLTRTDKINEQGQGKYFIQDGILYEREGWTEWQPL